MIDYTIYNRERLTLSQLSERSREWSLFISGLNPTDRVRTVFARVNARRKHWLVHNEYDLEEGDKADLAGGELHAPAGEDEADYWHRYLEDGGIDLSCGEVCIDITGLMRPHLAYLVPLLESIGGERVHILYSDPQRYEKAERTEFVTGEVTEVRQVAGFEGQHTTDTSNDLLIIGVGYDHKLIRRVAESKENARKLQLFGLPSLQPSMYQESVVSSHRAAESLGTSIDEEPLFASANDPFATAQVLHDRLDRIHAGRPVTNLYLSAFGPKPHVLGFALFAQLNAHAVPTSLLHAFADHYLKRDSRGMSHVWLYTLELAGLRKQLRR